MIVINEFEKGLRLLMVTEKHEAVAIGASHFGGTESDSIEVPRRGDLLHDLRGLRVVHVDCEQFRSPLFHKEVAQRLSGQILGVIPLSLHVFPNICKESTEELGDVVIAHP